MGRRARSGRPERSLANEIATGVPTGGRMYTIKGGETLRGLNNWLRPGCALLRPARRAEPRGRALPLPARGTPRAPAPSPRSAGSTENWRMYSMSCWTRTRGILPNLALADVVRWLADHVESESDTCRSVLDWLEREYERDPEDVRGSSR